MMRASGNPTGAAPCRRLYLSVLVVGVVAIVAVSGALAAQPVPHRAGSAHRGQPVAPDQTGSLPAPKGAKPPSAPVSLTAPDDGTVPPAFYLPTASRSLVRACGESWRAKRMAGQTGDEDWRDFATKCLAADQASVR